jgi:hypothetical protein
VATPTAAAERTAAVTVTNSVEGTGGVLLAPAGLTLSEPDASGTFTVTLTSRPSAQVTIPLRPSNDQCLVVPDLVTLDEETWLTGAQVTVVALDDAMDDGDQSCLVQAGTTTSSGADYDGLNPENAAVDVTVVDDDTAGIALAPLRLTLSEPEGSGTFSVTLDSQPAAQVTIPLRAANDQCSISPETVTLGAGNWRTGAPVTVLVVDDAVADGDQPCLVQAGDAASNGADYDGLSPDTAASGVIVTVGDDDTAGFGLAPISLTLSEPEGSGTITITLDSQPSARVTIPLLTANDQCSVSPAEVTLDADNWRAGAPVTVLAVDDDVDDGDQSCLIEAGDATSSGPDYGGLSPGVAGGTVTVTVGDDDTAGIAIAPTRLTLSEPVGSADFVITLDSQPSAPVTIPLRASNGQCSPSPEVVTLDAGNWRTGAPVIVFAVDDAVADGDQPCLVQAGTASSRGAEYDGLSPEESAAAVTVTVGDDDTAGIAIAPSRLTLSEPEGSGAISITLTSQPAAPVTIPLRTSNTQCSVSSEAVTLDAGNWRTGALVTVRAVDDVLDDGAQPCLVQTGAASSPGADYDGLSPGDAASVNVTVADNDASGIVLTQTSLTLNEPDGSGAFTITLNSQPAAPVTIRLDATNDQCSVSPDAVILDSDNWRRGAGVRVLAVDDQIDDGDQPCLVQTGAATSAAADYDALSPDDVLVTIVDDDTAGILLAPTSLVLSEPEDSSTFTVTLNSQPSAQVTIPLNLSSNQCAISSTAIAFDGDNWQRGASVTVKVVDDQVDDGEQLCLIEAGSAVSSGADYGGLSAENPGAVTVTVTDDDSAGIVLGPTSLTLTETGSSATFSITLTSQPTATVVISMTTDGQTTASPSLLTFTDRNWQEEQIVAVRAVDDDVAEGQHGSVISQTAASGDGNYDGVQIESVTAQVTDDDVTGVRLSPSEIQVVEGGPPQRYQVALTSQPLAPVTIDITSDSQILVTPTLLAFAAPQWNVPQTVTITAVDDSVTEGLHASTITHTSSSEDEGYLALAIQTVAIRIADKGMPTAVITPTAEVASSFFSQIGELVPPGQVLESITGIFARLPRFSPVLIFVAVLAVVAGFFQLIFGRR